MMLSMKTKQYLVLALIAVLIFASVRGTMRPDPGLLSFRAKGELAYGYGTSDDRSVSQVTQFLDEHPRVETLVLRNMPGTTDADMNLRLARRIRARGLNTHLERSSRIASGAVDLFLAGTQRTMECGARIGVHSWSTGGEFYPANMGRDPRQRLHERFLTDMGINPAFYAFTREAALPDDLYILTASDIERFGLLTQPLDCS